MARLKEAVGIAEVEIREIDGDQAKKEIAAFFAAHDGETIFPSDVSADLRLDYDLVCQLIEQLEAEGSVGKI